MSNSAWTVFGAAARHFQRRDRLICQFSKATSEIRGGNNSGTYKAAFGSDAVMWTTRSGPYTFKNNISRIDLKFVRQMYSESTRSTYTNEAVCEIQKPPQSTKF